MKHPSEIFRVKADHEVSLGLSMDVYSLIMRLEKHLIKRSRSWAYRIAPGETRKLINPCGKEILVHRVSKSI